jgi:hypothetical protein
MTKMTLYLDENRIKKAKKIAKENRTSVSKMIARFIDSLGKPYKIDRDELSPVVKDMIGLIPDTGKSYKEIREEYYEHIRKKGEK